MLFDYAGTQHSPTSLLLDISNSTKDCVVNADMIEDIVKVTKALVKHSYKHKFSLKYAVKNFLHEVIPDCVRAKEEMNLPSGYNSSKPTHFKNESQVIQCVKQYFKTRSMNAYSARLNGKSHNEQEEIFIQTLTKLLEIKWIDVHAESHEKHSCLYYAALSGSVPALRLLVQSGARLDRLEHYEDSEGSEFVDLFLCVLKSSSRFALSDEVLKYLIEQRAHTDRVDNNGDSPVHWLAALGKVELLKLLPKDEVLKSNAKNWTTLHFAIERKEMETALWLAKTYPELTETKTADGQTPSELAVAYGFLTDDEVFQLANCIPSRTESANIQDRPRSPKDILLLKAQSNEVELTYLRNLVDRHDQKLKEIEKRLKNIDGLSTE